ncbi:Aldo/keto reductase [Ceraceosorus guamensis]|uniref:Aldo/keto reductase n=1 Tax=Ceraceosorus guamensis TaxID=1522189 RepID=A0A316VQK2_9BASI|nr:Aldo/keto reductase [Ceraceosorus guamensis]PWN39524.1 Aldo/keto reductase [Ceraceosorus guamensis]
MPIAPAQDPPESYWGALPTLEQVLDVSSAAGEAARVRGGLAPWVRTADVNTSTRTEAYGINLSNHDVNDAAEPARGRPNRSLREDISPIVFGGGILRLGDGQYRDTSEEKVKGLDSFRVVHLALSYGINAIDTSAYYYPSEILLGRILRLLSPLHPRSSYRLLTKCGRYGPSLEHFDYSPKGVRESVGKSLKRLNTSYLDQVLLHDVEFVAEKVGASHEQGFDARDAARHEGESTSGLALQKSLGLSAASWGTSCGPGDAAVLGALQELFNLKDEGLILNVGISGYPLPVLLRICRLAYIELGRPLDCVLSYSQDCLHSDLLRAWRGLFEMDQRQSRTSHAERNGKWNPPLLLNGSPFSMGLLTEGAVPDWHPAPQELKDACLRAAQSLLSASSAPHDAAGLERHHGTGFPTLVGMATCDHVHAAIQTMRVLMARTSAQNSCETNAKNGASNGERQSQALQDAAEKKVKDMVRESGYVDWSWASG